jgi:replicative DNA helicase
MEMSVIQLAIRGVAVESNYHMKQLNQTGFERAEYFTGLNNMINEMQKLPILIDDRPSLTIGEIKGRARTWKRKFGLDILFVDYIQLAGGSDDVRIRTGETSRGLKHIAKELDIPVIGLSQLSRGVESRGGSKRPMLHDLKEAGDIEQDADIVSFIYRPEYYGFMDYLDEGVLEDGENTEFIVAKNRSGGLGTIGVWFDGNKTKFMDVSPFKYTSNENDNGIDF